MRSSTLAAAALLLTTACPSYTVIPDADRAAVEEARNGQLLWLKQSMYFGPFYDDDRYMLLHPRRFEELTYLRTIEGDPIAPPPAQGIVPAGTRVRVERIEWPTGEAVFRRPLYTPRYTTWVFLRVARDRGDTTLERDQRHILLLPAGIHDQETFDQWFGSALSPDDPSSWLSSLPDNERAAIFEKRAVVGMDYDALTAALGFPDRVTGGVEDGVSRETATWGPLAVVMESGKAVRIEERREP
jgi:hypothetical protein